MTSSTPPLHVISPSGRLEVRDDLDPMLCPIDFFERWTFAKFLDPRTYGAHDSGFGLEDTELLALGFESSQPYSEYGSYGTRRMGVQVLAYADQRWRRVALDMDERRHDEHLDLTDVALHIGGVFAYIRKEELALIIDVGEPFTAVDLHVSDQALRAPNSRWCELVGTYTSVAVPDARTVVLQGPEGFVQVSLDAPTYVQGGEVCALRWEHD